MAGFRPAFWPTIISLPIFLILLGLGFWQIERLHWKEGLIASRQAALAAPPADLPQSLDEARGMEFRHVVARGEFLHDHEFFLGASTDAGETGYHLLTPLRLDDGRLVLVNRGWIPGGHKDPATRQAGEIAGPVEIEGLLRIPSGERPNYFVPENDCPRNYWFWIDLPSMARCGGLEGFAPFTVDAGPAPNPGGLPQGGVTRINLPNDHLSYAITWFSLAAGLVLVYLSYHRKPDGGGKSE